MFLGLYKAKQTSTVQQNYKVQVWVQSKKKVPWHPYKKERKKKKEMDV